MIRDAAAVLSQELGRVVLCRKRISIRASRRVLVFGRGAARRAVP